MVTYACEIMPLYISVKVTIMKYYIMVYVSIQIPEVLKHMQCLYMYLFNLV